MVKLANNTCRLTSPRYLQMRAAEERYPAAVALSNCPVPPIPETCFWPAATTPEPKPPNGARAAPPAQRDDRDIATVATSPHVGR